jgi:hypothetical protein
MRRNAGFRLGSVALAAIDAGLESGMNEMQVESCDETNVENRTNLRLKYETSAKR